MFRIRFHGRGGQGMKTASRILGTAFFLEGYEVQDAPRYGAERRGAPLFAYVRADRNPINERGVISSPDLVVVSDDTLVPVPAAGVLQGIGDDTVLLINTHETSQTWQHRLNISSPVVTLPASEEVEDRADLPFVSALCAGAAARLVEVISRDALRQAIEQELAFLDDPEKLQANLEKALGVFDTIAEHTTVRITEGAGLAADAVADPQLITLPFEGASVSAPVIHAGLTSVQVNTGLWRTMRPVIDYDHCKGCWWVCSTFCPDGVIDVVDNRPVIDYDHCKGCLICAAQCPPHAIGAIPESQAIQEQAVKNQEKGTAENVDTRRPS
jgi:pyruvate ferredoxin oxidoreductase gamma subunit